MAIIRTDIDLDEVWRKIKSEHQLENDMNEEEIAKWFYNTFPSLLAMPLITFRGMGINQFVMYRPPVVSLSKPASEWFFRGMIPKRALGRFEMLMLACYVKDINDANQWQRVQNQLKYTSSLI